MAVVKPSVTLRRVRGYVALLLVVIAAYPAQAEVGELLDRYAQLPQLTSRPSVSADGNLVVFSASEPYWLAVSRIMLLDRHRVRTPRAIAQGRLPVFSPDGERVAFFSAQSGDNQVWLFDRRSETSWQLSHVPGGLQAPAQGLENGFSLERLVWTAEGKSLLVSHATSRQRAEDLTAKPWLQVPKNQKDLQLLSFGPQDLNQPIVSVFQKGFSEPRRFILGGYGEISRIMVIDAKTGAATAIPSASENLVVGSAVPGNSRTIVATSREYRRQGIHLDVQTHLGLFDTRSGEFQGLTNGRSNDELPVLSPDGKYLAFLRNDSTEEDEPKAQRKLMLLDVMSGRLTHLQIDLPLKILIWKSSKVLLVVGRDHLASELVEFSASSGQELRRSERLAQVNDATWVSRSRDLIFTETDFSTPLRFFSRQSGHDNPIWQAPDLFADVPSEHIPLHWKSKGGETVTGMLTKPTNKPGLLPLLVNFYPNTAGYSYDAYSLDGTQLLLRQGYAVLRINMRTPHTWYYFLGPESDSIPGFGVGGIATLVDDVDRGIETALASRGIDRNRIGGVGHSNGGGALVQYLVHGNKLKCGIVFAPAGIEWWSGSVRPMQVASYLKGVLPWQDPALYSALEPGTHADQVSASVLFVVGGEDAYFPIVTSNLFNSFRAAGKDVEFLLYQDQSHIFRGAAEADFWQRKLQFLDHHLKN